MTAQALLQQVSTLLVWADPYTVTLCGMVGKTHSYLVPIADNLMVGPVIAT